ncbi:MAG TPA: ABC transporter substrate-binding protein [Thermomicrobiales bacterium]|nr:ABC transporter substrate-binding protein [Thermomicrobiales bacterium]
MTDKTTADAPLAQALGAQMNRRSMLKRVAVLGASVPVVAGLLAACGDDDEPIPTTAAEPTAAATTAPGSTPAATQPSPADATPTTASQPSGSDATPTTASQPSGEGQTGGTMIILAEHEVSSLSPDDIGTWVHTAIVRQMHDGLTEIDEMFEVVPSLATSWEISDDGLTYTFNLHDGVLFHDGEACTSEDVVYTYEFHMNAENASNSYGTISIVASVEAPDDTTFVMTMSQPDASFLTYGTPTMIYPQHYHSEIGEDAFKTQPIGTGPFKLKEYRAAEYTLVEAFEDHFRGRPYLDELRMNIVVEPSVRALQLQTGEADANVSPGLVEEHVELAEDANLTTYRTASVTVSHMALNHTHPPLSEKEVRQAMMYAIDRETIIVDYDLGEASVATGNLAPSLDAWYNPNVTMYEYDPDMASQLLEDAGWVEGSDGIREKDGQRLSFILTQITGIGTSRDEAVQQYLQAVGIEMEIREAPISAIMEGLINGDVHATRWQWTYGGWDGEPDSRYTMQTGASTNWNSWSHERVQELLIEGITRTDAAARKEVYDEIQEIVAEEVPMIYFSHPTLFTHFNSRIKGLPEGDITSGANLFAKVREWWIEE